MPYQQPLAYAPQTMQFQPQAYNDRIAQLSANYQNAIGQQPMYGQMPVQQPQQTYVPQAPQMVGRFVNDFNEVTANDVPMDGKWALFPKSDLSEIQARAWSPEGKIIPIVFKPVIEEKLNIDAQAKDKIEVGLSDEATKAFMERFDEISERLEKVEKSINKPSTSKTKKEVD